MKQHYDPEVPLEDSARGGTKLDKEFVEDEAQLSADADASTLHVIGQDSPWWAGIHYVQGLDNALVLGYPFYVLSFLGWAGGSVAYFFVTILSFYTNTLLARFHMLNGRRNIRFRDLARSGFGTPGFWGVWLLQWLNLLAANVGLFIFAGQSLKGVHDLYDPSQKMKLPYWIIVFAVAYWVFACVVAHLHAMRAYSCFSLFLILTFQLTALGISIKDGRNSPPRDYSILGTRGTVVFDALGALGTIGFTCNAVVLPELQSTVKPPAVWNFTRITLPFVYGIGVGGYTIIMYVGYWAYGNALTPSLLDSLTGPHWAVAMAYCAAAVQTMTSLHFFACPVFEGIETPTDDIKGGDWAPRNVLIRMIVRGIYVIGSAFVACLLPYFGDFVSLVGAMTALPLMVCFPLALSLKLKRHKLPMVVNVLHAVLLVIFLLVTFAASIASVRYIVVDAVNYQVFANISG